MHKQVLFGFVMLALGAMSCSSGDYCQDNCEYMQRCGSPGAVPDIDACVASCEQELAGVSEDCRDALDDLGGCAADLSCDEVGYTTDCVDEARDVLVECEGELFPAEDTCDGVARPCESLDYDQAQCVAQGCTFTSACGDYAEPCAAIYSQTDCERQIGCTYSGDTCSGTAAECNTLDATQCETQSGCRIEDSCTGTPPDCTIFRDELSCESIDGCHWY